MEEIQYKIGVLGESRVGKTKFINKFINGNSFNEKFSSTPSISEKFVTIDSNIDIQLKIWDTASQERLMSITKQYYLGLDGLLLVYDPNSRETFEKIEFWYMIIKDNIDIESIVVFLVENSQNENKVNIKYTMEGEKLAKKLGVQFYSVSSYNGMNIEQCFNHLAKEIYEKHKK